MNSSNSKYLIKLFNNLREIYTENDIINLLNKRLSEIEIELGKTISENDELKYKLDVCIKDRKRLRNIEKSYISERNNTKKVSDENRSIKLELNQKILEIEDLLNRIYSKDS